MISSVSIVVPARNEAKTIEITLRILWETKTVGSLNWFDEIIVVDDCSTDDTYEKAYPWADKMIRNPRHYGKGASLEAGSRQANGEILLFLDADLGKSAAHFPLLLMPVMEGKTDMCVAHLLPARGSGGFGLVKGLARFGIYRLSGFRPVAPLSGQRALRKEILHRCGSLSGGFGIEVGLTIDAARMGYRILEVSAPFAHRETGRDLKGFLHRGKQFAAVGKTLMKKWRYPVC